ncbi:MAG: alginate export family protein [Saprospiraceae bacterium]|nr:alginate export family protein [Saprospiraceae bacterium]
MRFFLTLVCCIFSYSILLAQQFDIDLDIRVRPEYRNGFSILAADSLEPAVFANQRSRLIFNYKNKFMQAKVSPQNIRIWGDVLTTAKGDVYSAFHEAWAEAFVSKKFSFRVGRQELSYDDLRILGSVDWLMQARSHDAFLCLFKLDSLHVLHVGGAYNANKESLFKETYLLQQYKTLQYLWYHGEIKHLGISALVLNNGMPYLDNRKEKIAYSQTIGARFTYHSGKLNVDGASYFQTGKIDVRKVKSSYLSANVHYKPVKSINMGAGFEFLSGKDGNDLATDIKSFNPLYGTNHKFNGYMDYFYVGNHTNSVGLTDVYFNLGWSKNKFSLLLAPHYFMSSADLYLGTDKQDNYLGTEIDLTLGYKLLEKVTLTAGYSQMFAAASMEVLKGGDKSVTQNWAYLSIIFNPRMFSHKG